ncbi:hypothetical protein [Scytonema millei]|uniref:Uncharacterized protein n=1 Tax=Scytonema millei VB511283 TaxID=1245923 RepID=A0A9X5E9P5_9CYAN|nr:hypothetical protein [Scytonema millei]NHC36642.1 hypothetical protein [Scytonema millei VB511283]
MYGSGVGSRESGEESRGAEEQGAEGAEGAKQFKIQNSYTPHPTPHTLSSLITDN